MAAFRTIIARAGYANQLVSHLSSDTPLVGSDSQWLGLVADDEATAITEATEKFHNDALMSDWVFAHESTEVWEITDGETILGWSANADGWPDDNDVL